jgi:catechol 2,3-dioxygenase-like lactoylglutathione lyase family enzyme
MPRIWLSRSPRRYPPLVAARLDHVVIAVTDRHRSDAFYREVIGAEVVEQDGRVFYRIGDQQLNVHTSGVTPAAVARFPVAPGNSDLCFEWPGAIADAVAHLERNGIVVETGPLIRHGARGRGTSVYFRDPDGSLLELISYLD